MASPSSLLFFSFVLLLSSSSLAFNITKILEAHPDYSTFNSLLTQTKLAAEINGRSTITVLAVNNGAAGGLSGLPEEEMKRILSVHVVLDYYDEEKLAKLSKKSTILTTMYQSTGTAVNQQGFLNITKDKSGEVRVGSAVPGAALTATIGKEVMTQPFNISVLQVSGVIHPDGIENVNATAAAPPPKAAAAPKGDAADAPASAPGSEESEGPALSPADTPADAPADGDVLSESPTPAGAAPADADAPGSADAPGASDAAGSTDATSPGPASEDAADSSASRSVASLLAVLVGIISMVVA